MDEEALESCPFKSKSPGKCTVVEKCPFAIHFFVHICCCHERGTKIVRIGAIPCKMMNDAPDSRLDYMKPIDIHDVEVSIIAWVSHIMPLMFSTLGAPVVIDTLLRVSCISIEFCVSEVIFLF